MFECLVEPHFEAVGLRVVDQGLEMFDVQPSTQARPVSGDEGGPLVHEQVLRDPNLAKQEHQFSGEVF